MRITPDELNAYLFSRKYHGWMSFASDARTRKAVRGLAGKGLLQVNQYGQFRATAPDGQPID